MDLNPYIQFNTTLYKGLELRSVDPIELYFVNGFGTSVYRSNCPKNILCIISKVYLVCAGSTADRVLGLAGAVVADRTDVSGAGVVAAGGVTSVHTSCTVVSRTTVTGWCCQVTAVTVLTT